jgi:mono/diheme cytochrome c family protein
MFPEHLPGAGGYSSLGFISEPAGTSQAGRTPQDGYEAPVGLSVMTIGFPRLGINCAVCHTATYRTSAEAPPKLVLGMPAQQFNPQGYLRFLADCASDPRFTEDNILQEIDKHTKLSFIERLLYRYIIIPRTRQGLLAQKQDNAWMYEAVGNPPAQRPPWGPGRIDPFNGVKFGILDQPIDQTIGNSDMMPLWKLTASEGAAFHWDGLNTSLTEVFRSSALGDGATEASIPLADLDRLQNFLTLLDPPPFPYAPGPPRDEKLWLEGKLVYERAGCASCHSAGGERFRQVIPAREKDLGTDEHRLDMWTGASVEAYNSYVRNPAWRLKAFRKTDGYVAVPLDGLWLRSPYLHNGSVPTLWDLLQDPKDRPKTFYRGYDVFDFQNIGFISTGDQAARFGTRFDTSQPGNGNQGHLYGIELSDAEKRALLEYLKSL